VYYWIDSANLWAVFIYMLLHKLGSTCALQDFTQTKGIANPKPYITK